MIKKKLYLYSGRVIKGNASVLFGNLALGGFHNDTNTTNPERNFNLDFIFPAPEFNSCWFAYTYLIFYGKFSKIVFSI